jgi:glycosyltransferase involved in cell wall biosynthesis
MKSGHTNNRFIQMMKKLNSLKPSCWEEIAKALSDIKENAPSAQSYTQKEFFHRFSRGIAFWTYDFGIDGVSIEISKYAQCLQDLLSSKQKAPIHFIAGDFHPQADSVIKPDWHRFRIEGANGWSKWDNGKWFDKLFYQDMDENSCESREMAAEIWNQAVQLAEKMGAYLADQEIALIIPVNVNSNPGNIATSLCTILVSQLMGLHVLNSNHDFYWEDGKPASERKPGEIPGSRDKFFRNNQNRPFFSLFQKIYPWNGSRWLQVNINRLQSENIIEKLGFSKDRVFEISTSVSGAFFQDYTDDDVRSVRLRMAHILSDGSPIIQTVSVNDFLSTLGTWMKNQKPVVCSNREGLPLDLTSSHTLYFLHPTRIIDRKRIWKDLNLIDALLHHPRFFKEFENNREQQIVLHITGPAPIEHCADLEEVLKSFIDMNSGLADPVCERIFLAFSVGTEEHPCFSEKKFKRLHIEDIYHLANMVLFPSETEGRGLPIIESSAAGIPIICSRYQPEETFKGVVGEGLPEKQQIRYTPFPEDAFSNSFLDEVTDFLLMPDKHTQRSMHNKEATRLRYSNQVLQQTLKKFLTVLANTK